MENLEFCINLIFQFDSEGNIRRQDWNGSGEILRKIEYLRWFSTDQTKMFEIGDQKFETLGSGLFVREFRNNLRYPLWDKRVGAKVHLFNDRDDNFRLLIDDLNRPWFAAARLEMVSIANLRLAGEFASEINSESPARSANPAISDDLKMSALEVELPLVERDHYEFRFRSSLAKIVDQGRNLETALIFFGPGVRADLGWRLHHQDYFPHYFDDLYAVHRIPKGDALAATPRNDDNIRTWYVDFSTGISNDIELAAHYELTSSAPNFSPNLNLKGRWHIGDISLTGSWDRRPSYLPLVRDRDNIYTGHLNWRVADNISFESTYRHLYTDSGAERNLLTFLTNFDF